MQKLRCIVYCLVLLSFYGCINFEMETFIGADGSGSAIIHYWTDIKLIYQDTSETNLFSFNQEIINKNFNSDGIEVKSIKVWEDEKDSTYHAEVKIVFDDINNLNKNKFFSEYQFKFVDGATGQKIFEQRVKGYHSPFVDAEKYSLKFIYHFPGQIITDNANERKNNTLIWKFSLNQLKTDKTLTATIKTPVGTNLTFQILALAFILILLWILLIIRKKRRKIEE
ncbi:MAG: hypothetical protein N3F03_00780 [Ignavibacteria bacterium]|nr:hypothetical protein [Ignavibacteria bacterium]